MAYTPELTKKYSSALRRIAWAINKPMIKTLEQVLLLAVTKLNSKKICSACRDNSACNKCLFKK